MNWCRSRLWGGAGSPVIDMLRSWPMSNFSAMSGCIRRLPSVAGIARVFATHLLAWSLLGAMGAGSASSQESASRYLEIFCEAWIGSLMQAVVGAALYVVFWRRPALPTRPRVVIALYFTAYLLFFPFDVMYRIAWPNIAAVVAATPDTIAVALHTLPPFEMFVDFLLFSCTFAVQCAFSIWRQGQARERALAQAEKDNLCLRLELEQMQMLGLRAQLEPHFLFNALNSISALVRSGDKTTALIGIGSLSALLRYALGAGPRVWVNIGEELVFVRNYLALQRLRYGERLKVEVDFDDDAILAIPIPPLLLQPLVENALKHDLECHTGNSQICLRLRSEAGELRITISNPLIPPDLDHRVANPGLGLGLRHTQASLTLAFGTLASLRTHRHEGRFVVELRVPSLPCG